MATTTSAKIQVSRGLNPRRNLPVSTSRKRTESNFLRAFERAYFSMARNGGMARSDFDLPGYGIADLVWISWKSSQNKQEGTAIGCEKRETVRVLAFEMKIKDWRGALQQAFRYSYFADQSTVVLPPSTASKALAFKEEFRVLGIGLWSFDPKSGLIRTLVAPQRTKARSDLARKKAITSLLGSSEFGQFCKTR